LNPKTLPMIDAVRLAIEPASKRIEVVGDVGEELARAARHRIDPVSLGAVLLAGGQAVGPDHGPGRRRALAGHRGRGFDRIDTRPAA
jgi:hypothetical protein